MDSPRDRLYLMREGLEGEPLDDTVVRHYDQCLGCIACVTACPSGVRYAPLIEATRAQVERRYTRPPRGPTDPGGDLRTVPVPGRLRALRGPLRAYQAIGVGPRAVTYRPAVPVADGLPTLLRTMEALAPTLGRRPKVPAHTPAHGARRATVGVLTGCVQDAFFPDVNAATVRLLAAEGCEVVVPRRQGCCGALSAHTGREEEEALDFARRLIVAFEAAGVDRVGSTPPAADRT